MQKIVIDNNSNQVMHIINLDIDDTFYEEWYPGCYIIDDVDNSINSYGLIYNKELNRFEEIENYKEEVCEVLPSDTEILTNELQKKDEEILKLKLALVELVEGGI